jgi:hypothetical protein
VYDAVGRWLHREPDFLHEREPEHHLEELALMTVAAEWLTRWQPISMHRALLAGRPAKTQERPRPSRRAFSELPHLSRRAARRGPHSTPAVSASRLDWTFSGQVTLTDWAGPQSDLSARFVRSELN